MGSTGPTRLSPAHLADLTASGLTPETIEAAGLYTETDPKKVQALLGWEYPARKLGPCLVFDHVGLDGNRLGYCCLKPDHPLPDRDDRKKVRKYEVPAGRPPRAYFPPSVRAAWQTSDPLFVTEGVKKALAASQHGFPTIALGGVECWSCRDAEGFRALLPDLQEIPWAGRRVFVVYDSDAATNPNVQRAECSLAGALAAHGAEVRIVRLPAGPDGSKWGLDDYLVAHGPDRLRELIGKAEPPPEAPPPRPKTPAGVVPILVDENEHRVNDQAAKALAADPEAFSRGGSLVRVVNEPRTEDFSIDFPAGPRIVPTSKHTLRERLTVVARWFKEVSGGKDKGKSFAATRPPDWSVAAVLDRGTWPGVRRLVALVEYPVMLPDGGILTEPGYHAVSGLMYAPLVPVKLAVPDRPSLHDAKRAVAELLDVVSDFPFADDYSRAAWVAGLLTPLARFAFAGPTPLFLSTGNVPGCGKGLLLDALALTVRGEGFAVTTYPNDGDELRKRVTAILVRGSLLALFDNVSGNMGGPELDALLTSSTWSDRILKETKTVEVPALASWYGTGNNVSVVGDTTRRVLPIRLDSPHERPEERTDIRRGDLRGWVRAERPRLLSAALTILRAYHVAGRPRQQLKPWGSFEAWSALVRSAVVGAGLPDPAEGRAELREHGDTDLSALGVLLREWPTLDPDARGLSSAQIVTEIDRQPSDSDLAESLLVLGGSKSQKDDKGDTRPKTLGYRLRKYQKRNVGGLFIDRAGKSAGVKRWVACRIGPPAPPSTPSTPPSTPNKPPDSPAFSANETDGVDESLYSHARENSDSEEYYAQPLPGIGPIEPIDPRPNGRYPEGFEAYRM